jgi:predicted enzyme related to lactoylglutathione lyase
MASTIARAPHLPASHFYAAECALSAVRNGWRGPAASIRVPCPRRRHGATTWYPTWPPATAVLTAVRRGCDPGRLACTALTVVILAGMEVTGLGWCGTRTGRGSELAHFYEHVLGLRLVHAEADCWVFELPDGRHVEIFGSSYPGKEHFDTGPVVGFAVRDLPAAVDELRRAGVELLGEPGPTWQHFRGPDGNVYELVAS